MIKKELQKLVSTLEDEAQGYKCLEEVTQTILDNTRKENDKQISQLQYDLEQAEKVAETKRIFNQTLKDQEELINQAVIVDRVIVKDIASKINLWNYGKVKTKLLKRCK